MAVLQQTNHRDPTGYTNPNIFDPGTLSTRTRREIPGTGWRALPGGGAHKCIGLHFGQMEIDRDATGCCANPNLSVPDGHEVLMTTARRGACGDNMPVYIRRRDERRSWKTWADLSRAAAPVGGGQIVAIDRRCSWNRLRTAQLLTEAGCRRGDRRRR